MKLPPWPALRSSVGCPLSGPRPQFIEFSHVDSRTKLIYSVVVSAANVHDSQALPYLRYGQERRVWGDIAW